MAKKVKTATYNELLGMAKGYQKRYGGTFAQAHRKVRESTKSLKAGGKPKTRTLERRKEHEGKKRVPMTKVVRRKPGKFGAKRGR